MEQNLKDIVKELGIETVIAYGIDLDGLYLPETSTIFIRNGLDEVQINNVFLHELGHLICKHGNTPLSSPIYHMKQESEADDFWIVELAHEYIKAFDYLPTYIDIYKFLAAYQIELRYYDKAESIFKDMLSKEFA